MSRSWAWLFPATYAVHIAEESWGGFPVWFSQTFGGRLTEDVFWTNNTVGLLLFGLAAALIHAGGASFQGLVPTLATIVLVNGLAHGVASVATGTYSPGAVSGALLWVPLGAMGLRWASRRLSRGALVVGVSVGLGILLLVFRIAMGDEAPRGL